MSTTSPLRLTRLRLENWRNFTSVDTSLEKRVFVVGPNAVGKSNLLDTLRFLRDIAAVGGGFRSAVEQRGGVSRIRCLAARRTPDVALDVTLGADDAPERWRYRLAFGGSAKTGPVIKRERVWHQRSVILDRPEEADAADPARLGQTALEQVNANKAFREIADFFSDVRYLHLVPQLVREPDRSVNHPNDPYGGDFLEQVARTTKRTRESRLGKINRALQAAVPQLGELQMMADTRGAWHLEGRYQHWRPHGARQDEADFSDGTLRLIGLLWAVLDGSAPLLLEEPELSLHPDVVRQLPQLFARVQRGVGRQLLVSSHSPDLIDDPGIGLDEVLLLEPGDNGTTVRTASAVEDAATLLRGGSRLSEVLRPRTKPADVAQLALFAAG
jgi:predicted ATPase